MKLHMIFAFLFVLFLSLGFYFFYIGQAHSNVATNLRICSFYEESSIERCSCLSEVKTKFPKFNFGKSLEAEKLFWDYYQDVCGEKEK